MSVEATPSDNFEAAFAMLTATDESKREEGLTPATVPNEASVAPAAENGHAEGAPKSTPTTETPSEASSPSEGASSTGEPGSAGSAAAAEGEASPVAAAAPDPSQSAAASTSGAAASSAPNPDDEILNRLAALVRQPAQREPAAPAQAAPVAPQPASAPEQPEIYSPDEKQFLADYDKEWGDVSRGEMLKRRAEYRDLVSFVFDQVSQQLKPVAETLAELATRTHLSDLKSTVSDYDEVRDKVVDWVKTQPTYLQVAYNHVINEGTVDEVADLINRFKAATGTQLAAPAATPAPAAKKETALPPAAKQAAASLAPVSSKRSGVVAPVSPDDFDGAFAAAAKDL